jgi:hypothetical protein
MEAQEYTSKQLALAEQPLSPGIQQTALLFPMLFSDYVRSVCSSAFHLILRLSDSICV